MDTMPRPMNGVERNNNQYSAQGYTYSHYYRNRRPYYHSNSKEYSPNNTYNKQSIPNSKTNNKTTQNTNPDDSLLLNDVYGKKTSSDYNENIFETPSHTSSQKNNNATDFSSLFNSFFQNNNANPNGNTNSNANDANIPDIETLLKFKKIFEKLNAQSSANAPIINLLYAIKPFIQESKKSIIDQIVKFMTISSALQDFNAFL